MLLDNINKNLNTEIQVQKIGFSIIRHFPYASVELNDVVAKGSRAINKNGEVEQSGKDTLIRAGKISLLFNLMGIFSKDVKIKKIILSNAVVNISEYENGSDNFHFWKTSGDSSHTVVDLENVTLDHVGITYSNKGNQQKYVFRSVNGTLSGKFSSDQFELKVNANLVADHFFVGKTDYIQNKKVKISSVLKVNNATKVYEFQDSQVRIADLLFDISGNITSLPATTRLNLHVNSHEAELSNMLSMLPPSFTNYFSGFNSKGKFIFQSDISGNAGKDNSPDIRFTFSLANGSLSPDNSPVVLDHLALNGTFARSTSKPAALVINSFNGTLNGRAVGGNLSIRDFDNPFLTLYAKADLDLNSLRAFIKHDTLESLNGIMKLNISFAGKIKDLRQYASSGDYQSNASGTIALENVSLKLKKNPLEYKNINGTFLLHDNNIDIQALDGNISSTDFHLTGSLKNFITFLLIPNQEAIMNIAVSSSLIDLNEILENKSVDADADTSYKIKINPRLVCSLNISATKLIFRKFEAANISGMIHIEDQVITSPNLNFNAMEGMVNMSATIATNRRDSVLIGCRAKVSKLNITELFSQMENFGEETVTDRNLKGKVSADVVFSSSWTKDLTINPAKVNAEADITIDNGELNDFKPILSLSKYLKLADLKHIQFSTMKNVIHIYDRKIFFPSMEIKSSALNLNASGTHDFDNMVDYKLNMLLSDVLGKKIRDQHSEFGMIEDDGLGRTKLFLSMKGPVDNPKFSYDKKAVSQKIAQDLKSDQQNVKQLLKQEFGIFKKDTTLRQEKKKKDEMQIDWDEQEEKE
ncbi:AsmA-like C-terminal region-containing protein [soil metagenome]